MIHLAQDLNLILQMIESRELGYVNGLASEGLASGAMDAFADAAEISCADDFGEYYVIVENVGSYCDGLGDGMMVLLVLVFLFFLVLQCTMFEGSVSLDNADLIVEIIITP